ncbi:MAG: Hsp20/alpha crystallin family protein [Candidatus Marinimicrobia bacterium]|jgi:HSP20 family protein|nr:Hsp20/alpha crystallin family protein [Candidatus Neomarinimicrobiota bacterium]MBT3617844.1 Hsp20/alpha crystallin family protein [Candidatus Neomarinimicrobiota bacterium]MBT3828201.1 Hsp20/alpha crystallin family protein [Candidatus Neomarinimicrobiota bacterium]MBT3997118.1 Hsp20/alpha crystallin family protein [Candidatus Neomarinimicrobiota bacterium]MBT4280584.1 Hsp20/alpha crystallin family protein [Candidatus Neomarinimicrobiota bacterium]
MKLIKWTPQQSTFGNFDRMLNDVFGDGWNLPQQNVNRSAWTPALDVSETDNAYLLTADLPGLSKKEVKIQIKDDLLILTGERQEETDNSNENYHRRERQFGSFERSFHLPEDVMEDKITAKFKNGQLMVSLPKAEVVQLKGREIKIS